jgi:hypothetical protein
MIRVFIPEIKRKFGKRDLARGFWRSDSHKIFYDYIKVINYNQSIRGIYYKDLFYNYLDTIKASYNQEALFYVNEAGQGVIYYSRDRQEVLSNRIYKEVLRVNLKVEIKEALKVYGGVTIYKIDNKYFKEVFYK